MRMHVSGRRAAALHAAVLVGLLAAGCGGEKEAEVVIEFPNADTCVLSGEEIKAAELYARLADAQDRSAFFDTMDFRIVMAPGMSEEDYEAIEKEARGAVMSLGAGNKVTVVRQSRMVVRIFTSFWFWLVVVLAVAGGYLARKVKKANA
jgi:hypothetical protein